MRFLNTLHYIIFICLIIALPACMYDKEHKNKTLEDTTVLKDKDSVELIYTKEEQASIGKWKNRSLEDLILDALNADRGALYFLGFCYLMGYGVTIDIKMANEYFSQSASLGFAPAIDKIKYMYLYDNPNPYLTLVYLNLVVSLGHYELTRAYHKLREQIAEKFGQNIIIEIEKIAASKRKIILKNQKELEKADDKTLFYCKMNKITDEDVTFDNNYWLRIWQKEQ